MTHYLRNHYHHHEENKLVKKIIIIINKNYFAITLHDTPYSKFIQWFNLWRFDSINRRITSLVVIREAVVPCVGHTVVVEHVVLPYFVRSQVKATLSGGIPNCIPTGWYEFECRAILLCDNVTWKQTSLSVELSREQSREVKRWTLSHRPCLYDKLGIKNKCHRTATTPRPISIPSSSSRTCKS